MKTRVYPKYFVHDCRHPLTDLVNAVELNHYVFMISLNRGNGSCKTFGVLSTKIYFSYKTEDTGINETKTWKKIFHANMNVNLIVETVI